MNSLSRYIINPIRNRFNIAKNESREHRKLEIGPGPERIDGFETVNIVADSHVDYVCDAAKKLPFKTGTFDLIYSSHILEQISWYQTERTLKEWVRILKPNGKLQIWVPNGLKIAAAFVDAETKDGESWLEDDWFRFNDAKDPCVWASGRTFTYGDGTGDPTSPNWHRALFSPRYLSLLMRTAGLTDLRTMTPDDVLGHDHGWINLGIEGTKAS